MRPGQSTGCSRSQEAGNATTASAIETFSGRHLSGFVCHRRMQPYSSPPDRLKNMLPHVGPTTSLRTVILRGDRGLAHTVAMIEVTCDVSFGSRLCENSDAQLACRTSISISSMWESIVLATSFGKKAIEKTILRVLRPSSFSHSLGHSRQGRARSKPGHVCCALKAEVISKHGRLRDGPLRVDGAGRGQHSTDAQSRRVTERLDQRCHWAGLLICPTGKS